MNSIKLSDYNIVLNDVGYFVFIDLVHKETGEITRAETDKENLKDIVDYFNKYLENT